MRKVYEWPYANEFGVRETVESDIVVLGGGLAGCFAAISAARKGMKVALVEKGATERSGSAGSGFDHWESACSNPCSKVTPKEIAEAYIARDADLFIVRQVRQACNAAGVRMVEVDTMKQLGEACGIEVKTASAGIRK